MPKTAFFLNEEKIDQFLLLLVLVIITVFGCFQFVKIYQFYDGGDSMNFGKMDEMCLNKEYHNETETVLLTKPFKIS